MPHLERRLRLTLVTETFPPEVNGVARTLGMWDKTFRSRGHEVQIIRPRQKGEKRNADRVLGFPIPCYPQLRFGIASPLRLLFQFTRSRPDLVHIATEGPLGLSALIAANCLGIPVASSFHTNFDHYVSHYGVGWLGSALLNYLRWFHNRTAVTLVPSMATQVRLREAGLRNVQLWSRGVDDQVFHPGHRSEAMRASLGLKPDDVLIVFVGRLALEKNLPALIQAYTWLKKNWHGPQALHLALVGAGPLAPSLAKLNLEGLHLIGEQQGHVLAQWYANGDIFAFPSCSETFGNCVLEAQASGLPVVAYACPAMSERISSGKDGFLTPLEGDLSFHLLELVKDANKRRLFAKAARNRAESQSWQGIFDNLESRYFQVIAENRFLSSRELISEIISHLGLAVNLASR